MSVSVNGYNLQSPLLILIMKIFVKRKILSIETVLSANTCACVHTHTHTHTHTPHTHTHTHHTNTRMHAHTHTHTHRGHPNLPEWL